MDVATPAATELKAAIAERVLAKKPLMLGTLAREYGITEVDVARALPETMRRFAPGESFDYVWAELTTWEKATFIMQHAGTVLEVKGVIPPGSHGHGYFNLNGETGIGGHLKVDDLDCICFLSMPFMGLESHSVQFFNSLGEVKFSIYAGRDGRTLISSVCESFSRLREAVCKEGL
jgi:Putative heme iron utilization protein